jgi:6-phospho 3-hexuloisomerase
MTSEETKERFYNYMLELAKQTKSNAETINQDAILNRVNLIFQMHAKNNRIFVYGAGRSGFIGRSFAQRLIYLGIKSCFISEVITHQYTNKDLLILISGSGEITSIIAIAEKAKEIGGKIISLSNNLKSKISKLSDNVINIKGKSKEVALIQYSLAPFTSLFDISAFAVLDSIGSILMKKLHVTEEDIKNRHASIE